MIETLGIYWSTMIETLGIYFQTDTVLFAYFDSLFLLAGIAYSFQYL